MLARTAVVAVTTLCLCATLASPAAAGGYAWMDWDQRYNPVGGVSVGHENDVWFRTTEAAERAVTGETPYFVYLDDDRHRYQPLARSGSGRGAGRNVRSDREPLGLEHRERKG